MQIVKNKLFSAFFKGYVLKEEQAIYKEELALNTGDKI